ncbi:MAG: hypothetical protein WAS36_04510 [Candidatus Saccharimonadales bacterium]
MTSPEQDSSLTEVREACEEWLKLHGRPADAASASETAGIHEATRRAWAATISGRIRVVQAEIAPTESPA